MTFTCLFAMFGLLMPAISLDCTLAACDTDAAKLSTSSAKFSSDEPPASNVTKRIITAEELLAICAVSIIFIVFLVVFFLVIWKNSRESEHEDAVAFSLRPQTPLAESKKIVEKIFCEQAVVLGTPVYPAYHLH